MPPPPSAFLLAAALALAGCASEGPASAVAPVPTAAPAPDGTALGLGGAGLGHFAPIAGRWTGEGKQPSSSWTIDMTLRAGSSLDGAVGTIEYPSLGCGGLLFPGESGYDAYVVVERLTHGEGCIDSGTIGMNLNADGTLAWRWSKAGFPEKAIATLVRRR